MTVPTWRNRWRRWWKRHGTKVWWSCAFIAIVLNGVIVVCARSIDDALLPELRAFFFSFLIPFVLWSCFFNLLTHSWWVLRQKGFPEQVWGLKSLLDAVWERTKASGAGAVPMLREVFKLPCLPVWDVLPAWQLAAELLGRLKAKEALPELLDALFETDPTLRAKVLWAIGEIGDPQTIPALIPFLGDLRPARVRWTTESPESGCSEWRVSDWAADALTKLGEGELAQAFRQVLERGDKEALEFLRGHRERKAIVAGLMDALDCEKWALWEACQAAWALGEMGAIEALPKLRKKARWLSPEPLRKACEKTIAKLEMLSRLPRPADLTALETSHLPKPADLTELSTETLPRPAETPKEGGEAAASN